MDWYIRSLEVGTPISTRRKLNKLKQTKNLRFIRKLRSQGKILPPKLERQIGRYIESQLIGTEFQDHKPTT